jgi:hypothetical protein
MLETRLDAATHPLLLHGMPLKSYASETALFPELN